MPPLRSTAHFIGPLLENLKLLVERDFELRATELAEVIEPFALIEKSRRLDPRYPFLALIPARALTPETADGARDETLTVLCEIVVGHAEASPGMELLTSYVRVLDAVVMSAEPADLAAGYELHSPLHWEVAQQEYLATRQIEDCLYLQVAQLIVEVKLLEV